MGLFHACAVTPYLCGMTWNTGYATQRVLTQTQACLGYVLNSANFRWDESLSDTDGYSEYSGKPSYNVSCDMPGQILYMNWLILTMPLSTSMLNCAISLGREGPGSCFTTTSLLSVKLCHQFRKRRAGELFYTNRSAQY